MRINSEEAMIKAIQAKREAKLDWVQMSRAVRDRTKEQVSEEPVTASRLAGA